MPGHLKALQIISEMTFNTTEWYAQTSWSQPATIEFKGHSTLKGTRYSNAWKLHHYASKEIVFQSKLQARSGIMFLYFDYACSLVLILLLSSGFHTSQCMWEHPPLVRSRQELVEAVKYDYQLNCFSPYFVDFILRKGPFWLRVSKALKEQF